MSFAATTSITTTSLTTPTSRVVLTTRAGPTQLAFTNFEQERHSGECQGFRTWVVGLSSSQGSHSRHTWVRRHPPREEYCNSDQEPYRLCHYHSRSCQWYRPTRAVLLT